MKVWAVALVVVAGFSFSARAGKVKEIYILTTESVLETLGFEWEEAEVSNIQFIAIPGYEIAVQSEVSTPLQKYSCVTTFVKANQFWQVDYSDCHSN